MSMDRRLVDHFVNASVISRQDMQRIILRASKERKTLVNALLDAELVHEDVVAQQIAYFYQRDTLSAAGFRVDPRALHLITHAIASRGGVLPYAFNGRPDQLCVALYDYEGAAEVLDIMEKTTGVPPDLKFAPRAWVREAIEHYYIKSPPSAESSLGRGGLEAATAKHSPTARRPSVNTPGETSRAGGLSRPGSSRAPMLETGHQSRAMQGPASLDELDDFLADDAPSSQLRRSAKERPEHSGMGRADRSLPPARADRSLPGRGGAESDVAFGELSTLGASFWEDPNASRWSWDEQAGAAPTSAAPAASFDLFDVQEDVAKRGVSLQEIVERQQQRVDRLKDELRRQREVIQVLAELLVEARVITRRDLKRRLKDMRDQ